MGRQTKPLYEFGPYRLDTAEGRLLRGGRPVRLKPKVFETLVLLVEHSGHVLTKEELMSRLWPDSYVEEANLTVNVSQLRKALGGGEAYIETVPKRGYRFAADVIEVEGEGGLIVRERVRARVVLEEEEKGDEEEKGEPDDTAEAVSEGGREARVSDGRSPLADGRPQSAAALVAAAAPRTRRRLKVAAAFVAAALAATVVAAGVWSYRLLRPAPPFERMSVRKLPDTNEAALAAISPDGRYVAEVADDNGRQSLWLRQTGTGRNIQLVAPAEADYIGVTFSRGGDYIYYLTFVKDSSVGILYRIPVLGGAPAKLIEDVDHGVTFSPDGRQLAFVRNTSGESGSTSSLIIANADGTGERRLATRTAPSAYDSLAWSPDGTVIACASRSAERNIFYMEVVLVRLDDGAEAPVSGRRWYSINGIEWLADGGGLIVAAREQLLDSYQLWRLSYPGGEVSRVTNDSNTYFGVSLSGDSRALVTTRVENLSNVWVVPVTSGPDEYVADTAGAERLTTGVSKQGGRLGIAWTPDGRLVLSSSADGNLDIWLMDADGGNQKQLTVEAGDNIEPDVSPDGSSIAFVSTRGGAPNIWVMGVDGSNQRRLTGGTFEMNPAWSSDGASVAFASLAGTKITLWKVPAGGGEPARLTDGFARYPKFSPDGRSIACIYVDDAAQPKRLRLTILPAEGGRPLKSFDSQFSQNLYAVDLYWAPDGRALAYPNNTDGVSNIWTQPLDGGPPQKLTDFKDGQIFAFAWSPDGKRLALVRGEIIRDVVLVSDFR